MLTTFDARQIILEHVIDFINKNVAIVCYENQQGFNPPTSGLWSRVTIQYSDSVQSGLCHGRLERDYGIINIQCFARKGTGDYELSELAEKWRKHFKSLVVSHFEITQTHAPTPIMQELGTDFFMTLVRIDFRVN